MEMAGTRKVLDRVPDDKFDWKAHPKSNSIGWVASHLAEIVGWVEGTLTQDAWDISPEDGEPYRTHPSSTVGSRFSTSLMRTSLRPENASRPPRTRNLAGHGHCSPGARR